MLFARIMQINLACVNGFVLWMSRIGCEFHVASCRHLWPYHFVEAIGKTASVERAGVGGNEVLDFLMLECRAWVVAG